MRPIEIGQTLYEIAVLNTALRSIKCQLERRNTWAPSKKYGYNEDQPRDWHGRWTILAQLNDAQVLSDASPDPIIPWADYAEGHHWVQEAITRNPKYTFSSEALEVFKNETTGPLKVPESNYYDRMHRENNKGVEEELDRFLKENKIEPSKMTSDEAKAFVNRVKASRDPRIRAFIMRLWLRESMYWLRRGRLRE